MNFRNIFLLTLLALCTTIAAAEVSPPNGLMRGGGSPSEALILPLLRQLFPTASLEACPEPTGAGILISKVLPLSPEAIAGLQVQDEILAIEHLRVLSLAQFHLVKQALNPIRDNLHLIIRRGNHLQNIQVSGLLPTCKIGIDLVDPLEVLFAIQFPDINLAGRTVFLPVLLKAMGQEFPDPLHPYWRRIPSTLSYDLLCWHIDAPKAHRTWLQAFVGWYPLVVAQDYDKAQEWAKTHPALLDSPIPTWKRYIAFLDSLTRGDPQRHADPEAHGVNLPYYILHYPHFHKMPALGKIDFTFPTWNTMAKELYEQGGVILLKAQEINQFPRKYTSRTSHGYDFRDNVAQRLLMPNSRAIGNSDITGGNSNLAKKQSLQTWAESPDVDATLLLVARINDAFTDQKPTVLVSLFEELQNHSPFLSSLLVTDLVKRTHVRYYEKPKMGDLLMQSLRERAVIPLPIHWAYYQNVLKHKSDISKYATAPWSPSCVQSIADAPEEVLHGYLGQTAFQSYTGCVTGGIRSVLWDISTDPNFDDPAAISSLREKLVSSHGISYTFTWQRKDHTTIAASYAREGQFTKALHWQQTVIDEAERLMRFFGGTMDLKSDIHIRDSFASNTAFIQSSGQLTQVVEGPLRYSRSASNPHGLVEGYHPDQKTLAVRGFMKNGKRHGRWQVWNEQGKLVFNGFFGNGYPVGPLQVHRNDGTLLLCGSMHQCGDWHREQRNPRYGFWQYFHKDGVTVQAEGWFEENKARGSWFYYHPNGQLQCKGIRNGKEMVGAWPWFDANGKPQEAGSTFPDTEPRPSDLPPNPADVLVKETAPKK